MDFDDAVYIMSELRRQNLKDLLEEAAEISALGMFAPKEMMEDFLQKASDAIKIRERNEYTLL